MNQPIDARQFAPATERNRQPILQILQQVLPPSDTVLEVSSGTGEHAVFFAARLHPRLWLPSDPNPIARASILAWQQQHPAENVYPPIALDASEAEWLVEREDYRDALPDLDLQQHPIRAIVNINMIHIAPWSACLGLMAGAGRLLPSGGILYMYGPYKQKGGHTAPSNAAFDASLRAQNSEWGVRDLEAVIDVAAAQNLSFVGLYPMPANNFSIVFQAG